MREVLTAWLALNNFVGYAQGMDMMCSALLKVYDAGKSATPAHDALASLAAVARINTGIVPLHAADATPIRRSAEVAHQIWSEVSAAAPSLQAQLHAVLPQIQMFVLRAMPPCFSNAVARQDSLVCLWDYILVASPPLRPARCRHPTQPPTLRTSSGRVATERFRCNFVVFIVSRHRCYRLQLFLCRSYLTWSIASAQCGPS